MTMLPPPQYDHPPSIAVIEHVMTFDRVNRQCQANHALGRDGRPPPPSYRFNGCAHIIAGSCEVWRIDNATTRRHELAHCNGWPADHPDHYVGLPKPVVAVNAAPMSRPYDPDMWARATPLAPVITDTVFRAISGPSLAPWPITRSDEK